MICMGKMHPSNLAKGRFDVRQRWPVAYFVDTAGAKSLHVLIVWGFMSQTLVWWGKVGMTSYVLSWIQQESSLLLNQKWPVHPSQISSYPTWNHLRRRKNCTHNGLDSVTHSYAQTLILITKSSQINLVFECSLTWTKSLETFWLQTSDAWTFATLLFQNYRLGVIQHRWLLPMLTVAAVSWIKDPSRSCRAEEFLLESSR